MTHHTNFATAYKAGEAFTLKGKTPLTGRIEVVEMGNLLLPSGKIIACDPSYDPVSDTAFEVSVLPGSYPVLLSIARFDSPQYGLRIACARVEFEAHEVASWQMATLPGQDAEALGPDEIFCYGVDAGLGCFMDQQTAAIHDRKARENFEEYYLNTMLKVLDSNRGEWGVLTLEPGLNICIFHSGWGDGCYASYWGLDVHGKVVSLVTDFGVLEIE